MRLRYQLIVFDWEGTLADTFGHIIRIVSKEAHSFGFGEIDPELARQHIELGLVRALQKTLPHLSEEEHQQLLSSVQQAMLTKTPEVYLIPGAKEFIHQLDKAHIHLAIASNKGQQSLQRALQTSGLDVMFKVTRSAGQVPAKPAPDMLYEIMEEYAVPPESTLMIGDSASDIEMANHAGVKAVGVDFYHQQKEALITAGAVQVYDSYEQLSNDLGLNI